MVKTVKRLDRSRSVSAVYFNGFNLFNDFNDSAP